MAATGMRFAGHGHAGAQRLRAVWVQLREAAQADERDD
jgi:hypothetical protein